MKKVSGYILFLTLMIIIVSGLTGCSNDSGKTEKKEVPRQSDEVEINSNVDSSLNQQMSSLEYRMRILELYFDKGTPEKTAELWADSEKKKNGSLQYSLFTEEYQKERLNDFESKGWETGTSSPWVDSYTISEKTEQDNGIVTVDVTLYLKTSASENAYANVTKLIMKEIEGSWYIEKEDKQS